MNAHGQDGLPRGQWQGAGGGASAAVMRISASTSSAGQLEGLFRGSATVCPLYAGAFYTARRAGGPRNDGGIVQGDSSGEREAGAIPALPPQR